MLGLADMVTNISLLISTFQPAFCYVQAQMMQFGELSAALWTAGISVYHLYQLRCTAHDTDVDTIAKGSSRLFTCMSVLCWGIPISTEIIALNLNLYSRDPDPWCWLNSPLHNYNWIIFLYGWLVAVFISNVVIWIVCDYYSKKIERSYKGTLFLLAGYSTAFFLVYTFSFLRRIWGAWIPNDTHTYDILKFGQAVTAPLQGFFNLIIYGYFRKSALNFATDSAAMPFLSKRAHMVPLVLQ